MISHREDYKPQSEKLGLETVNYLLHCSDLTPELFAEFADM